MATYKVLQDIEAEDKLLGPLSLKQFIFAAITAVCLYLSFFAVTKHLLFLLVIFLPVAIIAGFLAWPWARDQSTEIWLLAKIRFFLKPRRRIWDQDGIQELVTITAPKKIEHILTNNLSQTEVKSRLRALADTIDSRGWAIKNINVNLSTNPSFTVPDPGSDRLIDLASLPREVPSVEVMAADDILDPHNNPVAQHLDQMIGVSTKEHRQQLLQEVSGARGGGSAAAATLPAPQGLWFGQQGSAQPATSSQLSPDEQVILAQLHPDPRPQAAYGNMRVIDPKGRAGNKPETKKRKSDTPSTPDPAILELAHNDDLNVATIARQANKDRKQPPDDEVVVSLR